MNIEVFDMYFATLVGMSDHPGYSRDNVTQPTLEECAERALQMMVIRQKVMGDK